MTWLVNDSVSAAVQYFDMFLNWRFKTFCRANDARKFDVKKVKISGVTRKFLMLLK